MKRDSFPALTIIVLIFGVAALFQSTMGSQKTNGCFWDRDTLAFEASGYPGITEIITGRFDRFPPLYYEMRLERVANEIESAPDNLDLYDDAGVACDRLGRHDEAIEWMARKRDVLDRLANEGKADSEHEYHYLANLGTMHIHRWLNNGANRDDLYDVERSHELIAAAIELNPDAHFGRERYQLLAIKWILDGYLHDEDEYWQPSIVESIPGNSTTWGQDRFAKMGYDDIVDGFAGLIALGNAWESIDIYYALSLALNSQNHTSLYLLAQYRIVELVQDGKRSLSPDFDYNTNGQNYSSGEIFAEIQGDYPQKLSKTYYPNAREEADGWVQRRNEYALEQLQRGDHPDTHPSFWADWVETTSPPKMPGRPSMLIFPIVVLGVFLLITGIALFIIFKVVKFTKRRLRTPAV